MDNNKDIVDLLKSIRDELMYISKRMSRNIDIKQLPRDLHGFKPGKYYYTNPYNRQENISNFCRPMLNDLVPDYQ